MIPDKGTITIYKFNSDAVLKHLTDEQAGQLFKAILKYGQDGKITDFENDGMVSMLFDLYRRGIDELDEKYQIQRQKRKEAGRKGGSTPRKSKAKQNLTMLSNAKQEPAKQANESIYVDVDVDVDGYVDVDGEEYINNKNINNIDNSIHETFEKIWMTYPYQERKESSCRQYINRIREGWKPEQLLKAAEHYSEYCKEKKVDKQYIIRPWNFYGEKKLFQDYIESNGVVNDESENRGPYSVRDNFFG